MVRQVCPGEDWLNSHVYALVKTNKQVLLIGDVAVLAV